VVAVLCRAKAGEFSRGALRKWMTAVTAPIANRQPIAAEAVTIHQWRPLATGFSVGGCSPGGGGGSCSGPFQAEEPRLPAAPVASGPLSGFADGAAMAAAAVAGAGFPSTPAGGLLSAFADAGAAGAGDFDDGGPPTNRGLAGADGPGVGVADEGLLPEPGGGAGAGVGNGDAPGNGALVDGVFAGGGWLRGGASESSSSTASNAELSTVWLIAGTLPTTSVAVARSCFPCETSLQLGGGLIITIPPHFGQARICPTAAGSRTFSRDLQVVQVRVKRSINSF
jgi:hypothetical protein